MLIRIAGKSATGEKNANGIREALQIGLTNVVQIAAKPDGYFANALIKILLPDKLKSAEKALRMVVEPG